MKLTEEEKRILHYVRCHYLEWIHEVETLSDSRVAIRYDLDRVQTSATSDNVFELAMQIEHYQECIDKVERCLWNVYRTDQAVIKARRVLCLGEKPNRKHKTKFYAERKLFAQALYETFREEIENDII